MVGVDNKGALSIVHHLKIALTFNRYVACVTTKHGGIRQLSARIGNHTATIGQGYMHRIVASNNNLPYDGGCNGHLLHGFWCAFHPHQTTPKCTKQQRNNHCSHTQKTPFVQVTTLHRNLSIGSLQNICFVHCFGFATQDKVF